MYKGAGSMPAHSSGRLRWGVIVPLGLVLLGAVAFLGYAASRPAGPRRYVIPPDQGAAIASAVTSFQKDTGTFPRTLEELVPKYLAVVPERKRAAPGLVYQGYPDERYPERGFARLYVEMTTIEYYPAAHYDFSDGTWHVDS
jgi:hypothetical protein